MRSFFTRRRTPAAAESSAVVVATEREPLTPAQLADLEVAWAELRQAAKESGVTSFHACTRDGSRWQDDPESVRAMTYLVENKRAQAREDFEKVMAENSNYPGLREHLADCQE